MSATPALKPFIFWPLVAQLDNVFMTVSHFGYRMPRSTCQRVLLWTDERAAQLKFECQGGQNTHIILVYLTHI